jgi:gluconolactonase
MDVGLEIHAAMPLDRAVEQGPHRGLVGDVGRGRVEHPGQLGAAFGDRGQGVVVAAGQHQGPAVAGQGVGDRRPDAAAGAGDDHDPRRRVGPILPVSVWKHASMEYPPLPPDRWPDAPGRYPDPAVRVLDPRFDRCRLHNAAVERIATGCRWVEGPVWFGDHRCLVWSDIPNNRMLRWDEATGAVTLFRSPSNYANGNTRDRQGRLVSCEHLTRRVTRTEHDGSITVLIDRFDGKPLNAPNDVVVASDGSVWFTDPGYGIMSDYEGRRAAFELPTAVYRLDPDRGRVEPVVHNLERPNGLCFSPDESRLYVVDSGSEPRSIHVYDVTQGRVGAGRRFVDMSPGSSDGIRCDAEGNLWAAAGGGGDGYDGVQVFAPDGTRIGQIVLPETCANLCFGGSARNRLFMAASRSVYAVYLNTTGA